MINLDSFGEYGFLAASEISVATDPILPAREINAEEPSPAALFNLKLDKVIFWQKVSFFTDPVIFFILENLLFWNVVLKAVKTNQANTPEDLELGGLSLQAASAVVAALGLLKLTAYMGLNFAHYRLLTDPISADQLRQSLLVRHPVTLAAAVTEADRLQNQVTEKVIVNSMCLLPLLISLLVFQERSNRWFRNDASIFAATLSDGSTSCAKNYTSFFANYTRNALCPVGDTAIYANITTQEVAKPCLNVIKGFCQQIDNKTFLVARVIFSICMLTTMVHCAANYRYTKASIRVFELRRPVEDVEPLDVEAGAAVMSQGRTL